MPTNIRLKLQPMMNFFLYPREINVVAKYLLIILDSALVLLLHLLVYHINFYFLNFFTGEQWKRSENIIKVVLNFRQVLTSWWIFWPKKSSFNFYFILFFFLLNETDKLSLNYFLLLCSLLSKLFNFVFFLFV